MARRRLNVFNLSFLDCMSCGFGAVILFYMIINTGTVRDGDRSVPELYGEIRRLEKIVEEGRQHLVVLQTDLELREADEITSESEVERALAALAARREALRALQAETLASKEDLAALMADLRAAEEASARLEGGSLDDQERGDALRTVVGSGKRQYLTGLKLGGQRILILVDTSASMLADEIARILVLRNQSEALRLAAPKWRQVVDSVDWITAQLPADSSFQIYRFAETAEPVLPGTRGQWLPAAGAGKLDEAVRRLRSTPPSGGTALIQAFRAISELDPLPDNVFLLLDGLPTRGEKKPWRSTVNERDRLGHLARAVATIPRGVPLNILLFPMEGDPLASTAYWQLARDTGGAFIAPSADWP